MIEYLKIIKEKIVESLEIIKEFFVRCFSGFKCTFRKPYPYIFISMFICSICFSEISYAKNSVNLAYGFANYCQDTIISEHYDVITFGCRTVEPNDIKNFNRFSSACRNINIAYYKQAVAFTKSVDNSGEDLKFKISVPSINYDFEDISIGTFFDYRGESKNRKYLATIRLEVVDKSNENIDWLNFPFDGKDASSYIPISMAESIVSNSNGLYTTINELIGQQYSLSLSGKTYTFSINNIYKTDTYLGPYFKATVGEPIITDLKAISEEYYSRLIIGSCSDAISIVGIQNYLGAIHSDGDDYDLSFSSTDGNKKILETPYDFVEEIQELSSKSFSNPIKTIFFFLTILLFFGQVILGYVAFKKHHFNGIDFLLTFALEEFLFLITYLVFYIALQSTIRVYFWCNLLTMVVGVLSPILISIIFVVMFRGLKHD